MSPLLEQQMRVIRLLQACSSSRALGSPLPEAILSQFVAAVSADDVDALRLLLDIHFPDRTKSFPGYYAVTELLPIVSCAARYGRVVVLKELLQYKTSFLDFAARDAYDAGNKGTILFLLEQGWDINEIIPTGKLTFVASAMSKPNPDRDMVLWLIQLGADPNARPQHLDDTAMSRAVVYAPPDLICDLIDHYGGDVHRGQLLHNVLRRKPGHDLIEVMGLLLDRGAPLNVTMYVGDVASLRTYRYLDLGTPLHQAAIMGETEAVVYLLSRGANASIRSTGGKTALQWAETAQRDGAVAVLRSLDQHGL